MAYQHGAFFPKARPILIKSKRRSIGRPVVENKNIIEPQPKKEVILYPEDQSIKQELNPDSIKVELEETKVQLCDICNEPVTGDNVLCENCLIILNTPTEIPEELEEEAIEEEKKENKTYKKKNKRRNKFTEVFEPEPEE
jgi:hypothetical protein